MKTTPSLLLATVLVFSGCATAPKMNYLSVGMTKQEVFSILGQPSSTAAPGNGVEVLRYELATRDAYYNLVPNEYFVKLINGRVDSYGKMGDFNSTKDPTWNVNIQNR